VVVAAIADTHLPRGSRRLPDACVERLRSADAILQAGDDTSLTALEDLRALGPPVHVVAGNVDEPALTAALPTELVVELGDARVGIVHDPGPRAGREERLAARFPEAHAVLYGHTHEPRVERHGDVWILNPGSPTERRRAPVHTMLMLEIAGTTIGPELVVVSP
jgi:putative phosphoesterase